MAWTKTPEDRRRDQRVYGDPEYKRNRAIALQRAAGRCSQCGSGRHLQVDHIVNVAAGGGHDLGNLRVLCEQCHDKKSAGEGGGHRAHARDPEPRPRTKW